MNLTIAGNIGFLYATCEALTGPRTIGGAAYGVAMGAAHCGQRSALISVVGHDFPYHAYELLSRHIDMTGVSRSHRFSTGRFDYKYNSHDQPPNVQWEPGALVLLQNAVNSELSQCDWVHVCAMKPLQSIDALHLEDCAPRGSLSFTAGSMLAVMESARLALAWSTVIFLNDMEWHLLSAREHWLNRIDARIIVTGKEAVHIVVRGRVIETIPTIPSSSVVDPTGAGDAFVGGVVSALMHNLPFVDAIKQGMAVADVTLQDWGQRALEKELFGCAITC